MKGFQCIIMGCFWKKGVQGYTGSTRVYRVSESIQGVLKRYAGCTRINRVCKGIPGVL